MTSPLAHEQSSLLHALMGQGSGVFDSRGLQVYQANRAVLAERTLASTYPVVCQLIGIDSFEPLARHFWRQFPPQRGDIGQWGAPLPEYLDAAPQLAGEPFLADVARIEWALHCAATAPNALLDVGSFALLAQNDAAQPASLVTSPGAFTLASAYPVVSLVNAHLVNRPAITEAAELLRQGHGEHALVWRQGLKPMLRHMTRAEHTLITALIERADLDVALGQALAFDAAFDFNAWLGAAVQTGLITGAVLGAGQELQSNHFNKNRAHHDKSIGHLD